MKVYFLINSLHTAGGTERMTATIANSLSEKGYDIGIICLHRGENSFFKIEEKVSLYYINKASKTNIYLGYIHDVYKLHQILKKEKPNFLVDVCSAMSLISLPASALLTTKIITWEHFNASVNWNPITSPLARKLASLYSYKIVTLTETDKIVFEQKYNAKNVLCIKNPVTIKVEEPSPLLEKTVLAIGRIEEQKGFDMLIDIWEKSYSKSNGWVLKIVGTGSLQSSIEEQITRLGLNNTVKIEPPTHDVVALYRDASVYAMSSRFEGLPLVLIEAMSMGLPIVSFDCETGPRDIVKNNITGFLVEPNNVEIFAQKLDLITENRDLLCEYSRNSILYSKDFSLEPILQEWLDLLK